MDENQKPTQEAAQEGADNPVKETDAFGQPTKEPTPPKEEDKGKEKEGDDIENHPLVKELRTQIETVKGEYGSNLSGQRDVIKRLETEIENLKKGGKPTGEEEGEVLFKEIKRSKDLTQEERDEMTDTEIKQMDEIAELKEAQNKLYAAMQKGEKKEEGGETDVNKTVQDTAKELSKGEDGKENTALANQIIESFKALNFNTEGRSVEDIKKLVTVAAGQVSDYKPPKEQLSKKGGTVKDTKQGDDPFGVDAIVEEATTGKDGTYAL